MDVPARWRQVVQQPEGEVPLDEAALLISARAHPELDVEEELDRLDQIAARVRPPGLPALFEVMFEQLGLTGDRGHYDDPDNSYLDRVLDRGLGIPISLSVLLIEVGRRCGVRLVPVGLPGHFLVGDPSDPDHLIDAFERGRRLDLAACEQLLQAATGAGARLTPEMLEPVGTHAILSRMLANLDRSFERRRDRESLLWLSDLRVALPAAPLGDRLQLAGRLGALGRFGVAASVLEEAAGRPDVPEAARARIQAEALSLQARLN